jgi:hypothetical protein
MQALPDRALSLASQLPPRSRQSVSVDMAAQQLVGAGLPAMQAALDRALSLASQLPPRFRQSASVDMAAQQLVGAGLPAIASRPSLPASQASSLLQNKISLLISKEIFLEFCGPCGPRNRSEIKLLSHANYRHVLSATARRQGGGRTPTRSHTLPQSWAGKRFEADRSVRCWLPWGG